MGICDCLSSYLANLAFAWCRIHPDALLVSGSGVLTERRIALGQGRCGRGIGRLLVSVDYGG